MQDPKDDPEFQAMLAELYGEMEESIPRQFGKTEMKHTLIKGSEAMTEQGTLHPSPFTSSRC